MGHRHLQRPADCQRKSLARLGRAPAGGRASGACPHLIDHGGDSFSRADLRAPQPHRVRTVADTTLRRRLLSIPGVSQVTPIGGGEKQYQVFLSPAKMRTYGLTLAQVRQALSAANENVSAGFLVTGGSEYLVTGVGRIRTPQDIAETVVSAVDGVPVRISDLGSVRIDAAPKRGEGSVDTKPAVILGVQKQPGANTLSLTHTLDTVLDEIQAGLPSGMTINRRLFRQADFIDTAVRERPPPASRRGHLSGHRRAPVSRESQGYRDYAHRHPTFASGRGPGR